MKNLMIIFFLSLASYAFAQSPSWQYLKMGAADDISITFSETDSIGNTLLAGETYSSSIVFEQTNVPLKNTSSDQKSGFIMKAGPDGEYIWHIKFIAKGGSFFGVEDFKLSSDGSIYTLLRVNTNDKTDTLYVGEDDNISIPDGFNETRILLKADKNGKLLWYKNIQTDYFNNKCLLGIDQENLYVTGVIDGDSLLVDNDVLVTKSKSNTLFVISYTKEGNHNWTINNRYMDTRTGGYMEVVSVAPVKDGGIYAAGNYMGVENYFFGDDTTSKTDEKCIYLTQIDPSGKFNWVRTTQTDGISAKLSNISSDGLGNLYFTGLFDGSVLSLGNKSVSGKGSEAELSTVYGKVTSAGGIAWLKALETALPWEDFTHQMFIKPALLNSQIVLAGNFAASQLFSNSHLLLNPMPGTKCPFIASISPLDGNVQWSVMGKDSSSSELTKLNVDHRGNIYGLGTFTKKISFEETEILNNGEANYAYFLIEINKEGKIAYSTSMVQNAMGNGFYPLTISTDFYQGAYVCGTYEGSDIDFSGKSVKPSEFLGFFIAKLSMLSSIEGTVYDSNGNKVEGGYVKAMYRTINQRAPRADSVTIDQNGSYRFDNLGSGLYMLMASVRPAIYPNALPTYYGDKLKWFESTSLILNGENLTNIDFNIIAPVPLNQSSGTNVLGGNVSDDPEFKHTEQNLKSLKSVTGKPKASTGIILVGPPKKSTNEDNIFAGTFTDDFGDYRFNYVPSGRYHIYVDVPGLPHYAVYYVEVDDNESITDMNYFVAEEYIYADPKSSIGTSLDKTHQLTNVLIYPNPASEVLNVYLKSDQSEARVEIYDMNGRMFLSENIHGGEIKKLNTSDANPGIYIIKIISDQGSRISKLIIE